MNRTLGFDPAAEPHSTRQDGASVNDAEDPRTSGQAYAPVGETTAADPRAVDVDPATPPRCEHHVAHREAWPWFPTQDHGHLAAHPYCTTCGTVAAVGGERARKLGELLNEFAQIARHLQQNGYHITEAQRRLIGNRLRDLTTDRFAMSRTTQTNLFHHTITRFTGITPEALQSYLRTT